jgi:outer membrane protein assembly factor BamD
LNQDLDKLDFYMRGFLPAVALGLIALLLGSCSSTPKDPASTATKAQKVDADEQVLKQDPLERNYDPHVIMKRAESFFEKEDYAEAGVEYQHFLDLHKTHILAPYAQYRLGLSYFKQVTTRDRDPEPVRKAMDGMTLLLKEYPGSSYENDARARIKECREHLASYELYVGKHYYRQTAYLAALHRFETVVKLYADTEAFSEAAYSLALTYADLGANDRAMEYLTRLLKQHPAKDKATHDSRILLAKLSRGRPQEAVASVPRSARPSIPPELPKASPTQTPAVLPSPEALLTTTITCGLNVSC